MVSREAPLKADHDFSNIPYFKTFIWRKSKGNCRSLRERDEEILQSCWTWDWDPLSHLYSLSPPSMLESTFPNLLGFFFSFLTGGAMEGSTVQPACEPGFPGKRWRDIDL